MLLMKHNIFCHRISSTKLNISYIYNVMIHFPIWLMSYTETHKISNFKLSLFIYSSRVAIFENIFSLLYPTKTKCKVSKYILYVFIILYIFENCSLDLNVKARTPNVVIILCLLKSPWKYVLFTFQIRNNLFNPRVLDRSANVQSRSTGTSLLDFRLWELISLRSGTALNYLVKLSFIYL